MRLGRTSAALTAIALTALLTPGIAAADIGQNQNTKAAADWGRINVQWDWSMPASMTDNDQYPGIPDEPMQPVPGYQAAGNALYGPLPGNGLFEVRPRCRRVDGQRRVEEPLAVHLDHIHHSRDHLRRSALQHPA